MTILAEMGLDPGMDHMSAMKVIHEVQERGDSIVAFSSVCGGLPAPEGESYFLPNLLNLLTYLTYVLTYYHKYYLHTYLLTYLLIPHLLTYLTYLLTYLRTYLLTYLSSFLT